MSRFSSLVAEDVGVEPTSRFLDLRLSGALHCHSANLPFEAPFGAGTLLSLDYMLSLERRSGWFDFLRSVNLWGRLIA